MYRSNLFLISLAFTLLFIACKPAADQPSLVVQIENPTVYDLEDITLGIPVNKEFINAKTWQDNSLVAIIGETRVSVQWAHTDPEKNDVFYLNTNITSMEKTGVVIRPEKPGDTLQAVKKTHAELWYKTGGSFENGKYIGGSEFKPFTNLRVPDECTDHSYYIKYEGPGWESDKVGYRIYLDWRNAIDIFGKKTSHMVLPDVGLDGYDSYHEMSDWGADILKVGNSLGIGSLGFWDGEKANRVAETDSVICNIAQDGINYSEVKINYYGWKINGTSVNLQTSLSILGGSRMTKYQIAMSEELPNLCTGIVKLDGAEWLKGNQTEGWNYMATWGKQTLFNDLLGMAVLFSQDSPAEITEDELSYVVLMSPADNRVEYYFLAAWEQEPNGITSKEEFIEYLDQQVTLLNNPVKISVELPE